MLWLALNTLRARRGGMLGAYAAVALALVLVASCLILLESSLRAPLPVDRLAAAAVVVQADSTLDPQDGRGQLSVPLSEQPRLPATLADRLRALPGVRGAVADRTFATEVVDRRGRLVADASGHGWSSSALTPLALASGRVPATPGDVVLDGGLGAHLGERLRIATARATRTFAVVGIAAPTRDGGPSRRPAAYFRDDVARELSGAGGRADLIGVLAEPGVDPGALARRVRAAVDDPDLSVLTGTSRGGAESLQASVSQEDVVAGLTTFGALSAFVAIFVVAGTFGLSVQQRHRELALVRAVGATPRQVRRMVAGEALLISLLAAVPAVPLSIAFALAERPLFAAVHVIPSDLHLVVSWMPFAAGLVTAIVTTQLAAFASARRAARVRPADALREAGVQRRPVGWLRAVAGLALVAAGVGLAVSFSRQGASGGEDAPAASMVLMVAAALLGPVLALPFVWLLGLPFAALSRGPGMLARANSRANLRRVASVATPLVLAISLASEFAFGRTTLERQTTQQAERSISAEHVLVATGSAAGLTQDVAAAARRVPGVAHASGTYGTFVIVAADDGNLVSLPARAVDPATLPATVDLGVTSGSLSRLRGATVAVGVSRAKELGWHVGDRVKLWLGDGTAAFVRVGAIFERPLGFGELVLPRSLAAAHVTDALDDAVFVTTAHGVDEQRVAAALGTLTRDHPAVEVVSRSRYLSELKATARQESIGVYVLLGVVVIFSALAVVNSLTMSIAERGRELALLRLVGASRRQVGRMIQVETLITALVGLTLGALVAAPGLMVYSRSLTGELVPAVPAWMAGSLVVGSVLLALAGAVLPTRRALRTSPLAATGARE